MESETVGPATTRSIYCVEGVCDEYRSAGGLARTNRIVATLVHGAGSALWLDMVRLALGLRPRLIPLVCLAVLLVDQTSKAVWEPVTFVVNSGGAAILPSWLEDALGGSSTFGAACGGVEEHPLGSQRPHDRTQAGGRRPE